jgi:hypothetical protein
MQPNRITKADEQKKLLQPSTLMAFLLLALPSFKRLAMLGAAIK